MNFPVILLGAGGHAKVLLDILLAQNVEILGISIPESNKKFPAFCDIPIIGNDDDVLNFNCNAVLLVNGVGSVGSTSLRKKIFEKFTSRGFKFRNVIHSSAIISENAALPWKKWGGVEVMAGAVINFGAVIAENTIINTNATIEHDCQIGSHAHIAPGATLSGNVKIGEGVHVGAGSTIIQGVTVGENSIIGAGSLVLHDIDAKKMAYGVPATVVKNLENL